MINARRLGAQADKPTPIAAEEVASPVDARSNAVAAVVCKKCRQGFVSNSAKVRSVIPIPDAVSFNRSKVPKGVRARSPGCMLDRMTDQIVQFLIAERDKLNRAIEALQGSAAKRRGRPPGSVNAKSTDAPVAIAPTKRTMSAAGRRRIAEAARKRWALIKAGKAASPFAKSAKKNPAKS
jgi:hypothetical protein